MEQLQFREGLLPTQDYLSLRAAVGWLTRDAVAAEQGLQGSLYLVSAWLGGQAVGAARIVGDGATVFYIQDVIVRPDCQGQGIGDGLMRHVLAYIEAHACLGAVVGLMAAVGKEVFYERYGFEARPSHRFGAGMTQFWKVPPQ